MEDIELKEFLSQAIKQIEDGINIEERDIEGSVTFEVSIVKATKSGAGLKFYVFSGQHAAEQEQVAKITIKAFPKQSEKSKRFDEEIARINDEKDNKWREWSN